MEYLKSKIEGGDKNDTGLKYTQTLLLLYIAKFTYPLMQRLI